VGRWVVEATLAPTAVASRIVTEQTQDNQGALCSQGVQSRLLPGRGLAGKWVWPNMEVQGLHVGTCMALGRWAMHEEAQQEQEQEGSQQEQAQERAQEGSQREQARERAQEGSQREGSQQGGVQ